MTGAKNPIVLYSGTRPIAKVEPPISNSVIMKVYFLPTRSPNLPKNKAPNGRITRPAEKVAKVARNAAVGLSFGKKRVEIIVAKLAKM